MDADGLADAELETTTMGQTRNANRVIAAGIGRWAFTMGMCVCLLPALGRAGGAEPGPQGPYERLGDGTVFVDAERALTRLFGGSLSAVPRERISGAIVALAEGLPAFGAIDLPRSVPAGVLDFRGVADHVQITGGWGGRLILGPGQQGIQMFGVGLDQQIAAAGPAGGAPAATAPAPATASAPASAPDAAYKNVAVLDPAARPASDLLALFCEGAIRIDSDVRHCAWIAGANAFGRRTVTADARVDDCLFLWFGINWPFQDYNAHQDPKNAGRQWLGNAQMWLNCKGGGRGTRMYLMVETNYGNPGPGVVLEDCDGLALYNGTTERASSQVPGTYWLKNCRNVQVGLRGINAFSSWGPRGPDPAHDITIEGGSGNILHAMRLWGDASGPTAVNSDPNLQVWMAAFQFETRGLDSDGVLRFCCTPKHQYPTAEAVEKLKPQAHAWAERIVRQRKQDPTPERIAAMEQQILTGRQADAPYNATCEETFVYGGRDLTAGVPVGAGAGAGAATAPAGLAGGRKLPPPPSVPAANAPRLDRPLAFTQSAEFGKALLAAGADPTGVKPSDDAFARLTFDMTRDEVEKHYGQLVAAAAEWQAAHARKDAAAEKAAMAKINAGVAQLWPFEPEAKGGKGRHVVRPRIEVPPGTFRLTRPILLWTNGWFMGAGPDKTVLKADGDFAVIKQVVPGSVGNFTVEGGRVGLAITGADHDSPLPAPLKSYVAGASFYNITFRNQTFAGIHLGTDDATVMGGAEFDQDRFVGLRFYNTGDYGIYDNGHMIDKWLCLGGHFEGQKKAGIALKFTCVIKGGVYGCTFKDIAGPAIDLMGGAPQYAYRPGIVTVDQCEFLECGRSDAAAVDLGYAELAMLTHSRIVTKGKRILTGCIGAAQIYEDLAIDVSVADGAAGMTLRAVRNGATARANGHTLRDVRCSGPVAFINDANAHNDWFEPTQAKLGIGKGKDINWDTNDAVAKYPPPNGWVHPFVFYNTTFADKRYRYSLLNVDPAKNQVLKEVDLSSLCPAAAGG
jgi:hypothetical protein